jgi:uracil-DNA glycosylase family 4
MDSAWEALYRQAQNCKRCGLCQGRNNVVVGDGNQRAQIMFIGEGPGAEEDFQGLPFVGPAGQLLDKMMASIGLNRKNSYIANIVKCRPPGNRAPTPEEAQECMNYLRAQVKLVRPKIIVILGATAAKHTISPDVRITRDRGIWHERRGYHMIATFHPSFLLRDPSQKNLAWADLKSIREKIKELGINIDIEA